MAELDDLAQIGLNSLARKDIYIKKLEEHLAELERVREAAERWVAAREAFIDAKTRRTLPSVYMPLAIEEGEAADALWDALTAHKAGS